MNSCCQQAESLKEREKQVVLVFPFERELLAASSRERYGDAFSMTGVWSTNEKQQWTWNWQVAAYDFSVCGYKRAPVLYVIIFFVFKQNLVPKPYSQGIMVTCVTWDGSLLLSLSPLSFSDYFVLTAGVPNAQSALTYLINYLINGNTFVIKGQIKYTIRNKNT